MPEVRKPAWMRISPRRIRSGGSNIKLPDTMNFIKAATDAAGKPVELFYTDWGTGAPVVLIHGWPLDHQMWEYQATFLAKNGCRVITYDRRGFGKSSHPWQGYDYDTLADDLKAVLDELDLQNVTLVGMSMGGGEVARYMGRHGGARVAKVVFQAAVTPYLLKTADNPDGVDQSTFDPIIAGLQKDRADFLNDFGPKFYGSGPLGMGAAVPAADLQWTLAMAMPASPKATLDCVTSWSATDFRQDLKASAYRRSSSTGRTTRPCRRRFPATGRLRCCPPRPT